jgi:hypothetical protein
VVTAALVALNIRDFRRGRLPEQRFGRAMRFLVPGLGFGRLLSIAFSVLRVFPLPATSWIPLTLAPTIAGFAIGFFLVPARHPQEEDEDDEDDEDPGELDERDLQHVETNR